MRRVAEPRIGPECSSAARWAIVHLPCWTAHHRPHGSLVSDGHRADGVGHRPLSGRVPDRAVADRLRRHPPRPVHHDETGGRSLAREGHEDVNSTHPRAWYPVVRQGGWTGDEAVRSCVQRRCDEPLLTRRRLLPPFVHAQAVAIAGVEIEPRGLLPQCVCDALLVVFCHHVTRSLD